jgi:hypothetical protein
MADRTPRPTLIERFGSYNNLRSNPYSDSERILDVRDGVLDPYTQIAQSALQSSYTVDSLSAFGNTFRARILGVVEGRPAQHLYPELYANSNVPPEQIPNYFIFVLRDETDQFAPDPLRLAATVQSYVNMIGLQGRAISEKPVSETVEAYGRGDIVEVYKPEQNSWNGAIVRKVIARNNFDNFLTGSGPGASEFFGANPSANVFVDPALYNAPFAPRLATTSSTGRLGTQADWDVFSPGVVYPPGSIQIVELFTEAARRAGYPPEWGSLPGLVGSSRDIPGGGVVSRESGGVVGRLNYTWRRSSNTSVFDLPVKAPEGERPSWEEKQPQNIEYAIRWIQTAGTRPDGYLDNDIEEGVRLPPGITSSATGLGQLLSSIGYEHMPEKYNGYGIPMQEAIGMLNYINDRYGHPNSAYSFHNFPKRTGERVYYIGDPARPNNEAVRLEKRGGRWYRTDNGAEVSNEERRAGFSLDESSPPKRLRYAGFFRGARLGQITLAGQDEGGRQEAKAHEGY